MLTLSLRRSLVFVITVGAIGCGVSAENSPEVVGQVAQAVGEPLNGFPSADERLMIMAINRGRSDPATIKGPNSTVYPARPPVMWNYDLSRSSRFHATNLLASDATLMHTSPCTLNTDVGTSGCDGRLACACASPVPTACAMCAAQNAMNTCGTMPFTRIGYFTSIANGEVAAAGYTDTFASVGSWLDEPVGADGHRKNLLDQGISSNAMGAGHTAGAGGCFSTFDVSDSGMMKGLILSPMPTASVQPVTGKSGSLFTFYATWADPAGGAPRRLDVVVDGTCVPLAQQLGTPTLNSTWGVTQTLTTGCHDYYYVATDSRGNVVTYPTTGSLNVAVGTTCSSDYQATAVAAVCNPDGAAPAVATDAAASPDVVASPGLGSDASASRDAAGASLGLGSDASTSRDGAKPSGDAGAEQAAGESPADAALPQGADASPARATPSGTASAGCGCHAAPTGATPLGGAAVLALFLALGRRKSRRAGRIARATRAI